MCPACPDNCNNVATGPMQAPLCPPKHCRCDSGALADDHRMLVKVQKECKNLVWHQYYREQLAAEALGTPRQDLEESAGP